MRPDEILFLAPQEIRRLLTLDECIGAVEHAFRLYGEGQAVPPAALGVHVAEGDFHVKAGILDLGTNYFAAKVNGNFPGNGARFGLPTIQGVIVLCDAEKGMPLAVMDSRDITSLRTAAATAVAAKYLARRDSRTITICGCGAQGRVQLIAVSRICPLQSVFAYDKSREQALRFAHELESDLKIPVKPVLDLAAAVRQSDICVTCTTSKQPLLGPDDVSPGTFIAAVGADNPQKQELHPTLMARSKIVCDILEQCAGIGDLHHALEASAVSRSDVHAELGEVVAGKKPGRESKEEITIFDSTGMALQDVAAAAIVYEKAERQGAGVRLSLQLKKREDLSMRIVVYQNLSVRILTRLATVIVVLASLFCATLLTAQTTAPDAASDWKQVEDAMGRPGQMQPGDVIKFGMPRKDLHVVLDGVDIKPALALGSWVAFKRDNAGAMVMGDLVLTESEVEPVMMKLQESGIHESAVHNHLIGESPRVMYMHIASHGDAMQMAKAVHDAVALTKTPGPDAVPASQPAAEFGFDQKQVEQILGHTGKVNGGVLQIGVPRGETITDSGMTVPPSMGVATALNFQPTGNGKAAITGDFVLLGSEVNPVIKALRQNGIAVTALHSHMLMEEPRLFFMHFWANDDVVKLAKGLRAALDYTNSAK